MPLSNTRLKLPAPVPINFRWQPALWLHLDLYAEDREKEVDRLVQLGARRYPWRYRPHSDFVVLEDPGGMLSCVVQARQGS